MSAVALPASPCTQRCSVDRRRRICTGCFRTLDEIAAWRRLGVDDRLAVLERCAARRRLMGNG